MSTVGTYWQWQYKDCLKTMTPIPAFTIQGKSKYFGLYRPTLNSQTSLQRGCIVFFPKIDHITLHFCNELSGNFKTSGVLGKRESEIFIFTTVESLEEFDEKTKGVPSNINIYADIKGSIAEQFGIRPMMGVINLKDIFQDANKKKYEKQTLNGIFFVASGKIVKSPQYQPKLQLPTVAIIKNTFEFYDKVKEDINLLVAKGSFCDNMSEKDIQTLQKSAWDLYIEEFNQMNDDLGLKTFKKKVDIAKPTPSKKSDDVTPKNDDKIDDKKPKIHVKNPSDTPVKPGLKTSSSTPVKKPPLNKKISQLRSKL